MSECALAMERREALAGARRFALVTPPSRRPITRDQYCTVSSKGSYYWQPMDLWLQGASLGAVGDAALFEGLGETADSLLVKIEDFAPHVLVMLVGGFTIESDVRFLNLLWQRLRRPIVVGGEAVFRGWKYFSRVPGVVGLITDFSAPALAAAALGKAPVAGLDVGDRPPAAAGPWRSGTPPDWSLRPYRHPMLGRPFASVLATYGCPFRCLYCNNNRDVMGWRLRDEADLFAELDTWAARGLRWIYFRDLTFGGTRERAKRLAAEIARRGYGFRWATFLRPEIADAELVELFRAAGCVQVQMGVESSDRNRLRAIGRGGDEQAVQRAFALFDRAGIRRGAHFMLGLPGESEADARATIHFARRLDPDYAAFSTGTVRGGTRFDQGVTGDGSDPATNVRLGGLDSRTLHRLHLASIRNVYLRASFFRRAVRTLLRNPGLTTGMLRDAWAFVSRWLVSTPA